MNNNKQIILKKAAKPLVFSVLVMVFLFLVLAPELLYVLGGKDYLEAIEVIPPVMIACVFQVVYSLYVNIEFYCKKTVYIATGTSIAAICNIVLNYLFIPCFGYIAAAYTTLAGYAVLFIIHFILVKKLGYSDWYDTKFNIFALMGSVVIMIIAYIVYKITPLRIGILITILVLFLCGCIYFKKELYSIFKEKSISKLINRIKQLRAYKYIMK